MKVKHLILLSGTPSLSRLPFDIFHQINMLWPGLLGETKYDFAKTYCSVKLVNGCQGKVFQDFSKGIRLEELNVLLKQTVMIRCLKQHVLAQLLPVRQKIMRLVLRRSNIASAMAALGLVLAKSYFTSFLAALGVLNSDTSANDTEDEFSELQFQVNDVHKDHYISSAFSEKHLIYNALQISKLLGFLECLSIHPMLSGFDGKEATEATVSSQKMTIFAHHNIVYDRIQEFLLEKGIEYIRIDAHVSFIGKEAIQSFQSSEQVKIAIIGISAGGFGLTLTAAKNVVFLELPKEISSLNQAESRAHRIGQMKAVKIYIFCAKWQKLIKSLFEVLAVMNGKHAAISEIKGENYNYEENNYNEVIEQHCYCNRTITMGGEWNWYCIISSGKPSQACPTLGCNAFSIRAISGTAGTISSYNLEDSEATDKDEEVQSILSAAYSFSVATGNLFRIYKLRIQGNQESGVELDSNASGAIEAALTSAVQVEYLRFEVSQYTGRIHLYSCIPGIDSRPRPLFLSFRPEEFESEDLYEDAMKKGKNCRQDVQRYQSALILFMKQWNHLRPIERRKLLVKPLQLPLSTELCYLMESLSHDIGGLLKCRSTRCITHLDEINSH
ncbi:unnamed protein product [Coffea canephora]|uniref:DH200=94 genomic scaffold, scaffold_858 n=1 Tax=Coffea canephora TaxID=49390 RepID=A0A068VH66_COFCA|nr:unnamed protein product [Coffea canephora]